MVLMNAYQAKKPLEDKYKGLKVSFRSLPAEDRSSQRAFLQSIVSTLSGRGLCCSIASRKNPSDIIFIESNESKVKSAISRYSNLDPRIQKTGNIDFSTLNNAWKNRVRTHLLNRGFLKIGSRYIKKRDIESGKDKYKKAFVAQAEIIDQHPTLFIEPRTRIMTPLSDEEIKKAEREGEESKVGVSLLPYWKCGLLVGRSGFKAKDKNFSRNGRESYSTPEYWKREHNIDFVSPDDEMLDVYVPSYDNTLSFPRCCVFSKFKRGTTLPDDLKFNPQDRIDYIDKIVGSHLNGLSFADEKQKFRGPVDAEKLSYGEKKLKRFYDFKLDLGIEKKTTVKNLQTNLKNHGPYSRKRSGKYLVIAPEGAKKVAEGFRGLEKIYSEFNFGKITPLENVGDNGIVWVSGSRDTDYTSTITSIRSEVDKEGSNPLAFLVLPSAHSSSIYYKARGKLFDSLFGNDPIPAQAITQKNLRKIAGSRSGYFIGANTASQVYIKIGGIGSATWVLGEPADSCIPGIKPGSTYYAYHDVSRRPKKKSSAMAYSAMTDSYGRYITTGSKPMGGEELTPVAFHEILVELLERVSEFSRHFSEKDISKPFKFKRLLFAKDGIVSRKEERMMKNVIKDGIPEEKKRPVEQILKETDLLPDELILDIIGVNKSPNKRLIERKGRNYQNVPEGTAISYGNGRGLLVSCKASRGTVQPLELDLKGHFCINRDNTPKPDAFQLIEEYYNVSYLNWSSVFKQGKYALPQILTQNIGENLSAGIKTPENMPVI